MGKKKGSKKGKKASAGGKGGALSAEDAANRAAQQAQMLQSNLARRTTLLRKSTSVGAQYKSDYGDAMEALFDERDDTKDITNDLSRQYKSMQSQLMSKILALEESNEVLREELGSTKKELSEEKTNAANTLIEKNDLIRQLTQRVESMEASYESVLNEALDTMASRVEQARDKWEIESYMVQQRNKDALLDFGLSHSVAI